MLINVKFNRSYCVAAGLNSQFSTKKQAKPFLFAFLICNELISFTGTEHLCVL
jgi:hypothetical protein